MNEDSTQPDSTGQEADNSVAKLGILDQDSLKGLLDGFLNEEEQQAPASVEQQEESEDPAPSVEEGDLSDEDSDQPEVDDSSLSKGVQKRINKLVAAKKAAQAELESQKAALAKLQKELEDTKSSSSPAPAVQFDEYVQTLDTVQKVEEEYKRSLNVILWCEDNINGGQLPSADGNGTELSDVEVRALRKAAILRKELELPARLQFLQQQAAAEAEVNSNFPWWNKPETEEYQVAQQVLKEFPELKRRRADWKHVAGLVVLGAKTYAEMQGKKKSATAMPIKRAPVQPSVKAAPPVSTTQSEIAKAKQRFAQNSSDSQGLSDLVKAMGFV